jgi:hypothetical protein
MLRPFQMLLACAGALAVAGAGAAYATGVLSSGDGGTYTACVDNTNGNTRIVADASACRTQEHAIQLQGAIQTPPSNVTVNCAAGDTIANALQQTAAAPSVKITINGTCTESVQIDRDNVTLKAANPGDGLAAPSGDSTVVAVEGARDVVLGGLTITGGAVGISGSDGASFTALGVTVRGPSNIGLSARGDVSGTLDNVTVDGAGMGLDAMDASSFEVAGSTIENSRGFGVQAEGGSAVALLKGTLVTDSGFFGAIAHSGAVVEVQNATIQNSGGGGLLAFSGGSVRADQGTLIRNNRGGGVGANGGDANVFNGAHVTGNGLSGVEAFNGGRLTIEQATIDSNSGDGINVQLGSTATITNTTVTQNGNDGVSLRGTSHAGFGDDTITDNGGWGIDCFGSLSGIDGPPVGTVSGNPAGDTNCPHS